MGGKKTNHEIGHRAIEKEHEMNDETKRVIVWRDDYRLAKGDLYWAVQAPTKGKSGDYGTLAQAARKLARTLADEGDAQTMAGYARQLDQAVAEITTNLERLHRTTPEVPK